MKKKFLLIAGLAAALCFTAPMATEAAGTEGWQQGTNGWWYLLEDGTYYANSFQTIGDVDYYFDGSGYMATGWRAINGNWYYFGTDGAMAADEWKQIGGTWYYFYEDGVMADGVTSIWNGTKYDDYLLVDGAMQTGWTYYNEDGNWYLADDNGVLKTGWLYDGANWFYLDLAMYADGEMTVWAEDGTGMNYFFDENGHMVTGWHNYGSSLDIYGNWAYCNADGTPYTGWLAYGSDWYYISNGWMRTEDWVNTYVDAAGNNTTDSYSYVDGSYVQNTWVSSYYVGRDGKMVKGWYELKYFSSDGYTTTNEWIYTNPADGSFYTGWVSSGGKWYYIDANGYMVKGGSYTVGTAPEAPEYPMNTDSYVREDGTIDWDAYYTDWDTYYAAEKKYQKEYQTYLINNTYIFGDDGAMVTNGWYKYKNTYGELWYYANAAGQGYHGWLSYGGHWYYLDYGYMVTNSYVEGGYYVGANGIWK